VTFLSPPAPDLPPVPKRDLTEDERKAEAHRKPLLDRLTYTRFGKAWLRKYEEKGGKCAQLALLVIACERLGRGRTKPRDVTRRTLDKIKRRVEGIQGEAGLLDALPQLRAPLTRVRVIVDRAIVWRESFGRCFDTAWAQMAGRLPTGKRRPRLVAYLSAGLAQFFQNHGVGPSWERVAAILECAKCLPPPATEDSALQAARSVPAAEAQDMATGLRAYLDQFRD
jgi:hypothetical protein